MTGSAVAEQIAKSGTPDPSWRDLYRAGSLAAFAFVVLVLIPIVLVFIIPVPPTGGEALLGYIAAHRVTYLIQLVCFVGLAVPALVVFASLAVALWRANRTVALIGGLLGVSSEVIALALGSSPQSLHGGLVVLSDAFTSAGDDATRGHLIGAAEALIAATNAVSWAGILTAVGILTLSLVMRRAGFGRAVAIVGIVTGVLGIPSEALRPILGIGYLLYGLLLPIWFALVGRELLLLYRHHQPSGMRPPPASASRP